MRQLAFIAATLAVALTGCGGSSHHTPAPPGPPATPAAGKARLTSPCTPPIGTGRMGVCVPHILGLPKTTTGRASGPHGVDVSSYQPHPDWAAAKNAGLRFAVDKAGEGATWTDPTFAANWRAQRRLRIPHAAYYFLRPGSPTGQARRFVALVRAAGGFDSLPPVADVEVALNYSPCAFANEVRRLTGRHAFVIYTAPGLWPGGSSCGAALWIATYGPVAINASSWRTHIAWQHSDGVFGPLPHYWPGIGVADMDISTGLLALTPTPPRPPAPKPSRRAQLRALYALYRHRHKLAGELAATGRAISALHRKGIR